MNPPSIDPLSEKLGSIIAKLDMVQRVQAEDRVAAATYRTEMRSDLTAVKETVSDVKYRANNNADELAELRSHVDKQLAKLTPDVDDYRSKRDQAAGAGKLTKILWAIFSAIGLGGAIAFLQSFMHKPHP